MWPGVLLELGQNETCFHLARLLAVRLSRFYSQSIMICLEHINATLTAESQRVHRSADTYHDIDNTGCLSSVSCKKPAQPLQASSSSTTSILLHDLVLALALTARARPTASQKQTSEPPCRPLGHVDQTRDKHEHHIGPPEPFYKLARLTSVKQYLDRE